MKKQLVLSLVLIIILALSACAATDTEVTSGTLEPTSTEVAIDAQLEEELKALSQSVKKLETVYNELVPIAVSNGWENNEIFVKEANASAAMVQVCKEIINDPSMLEGKSAQDMIDAIDEMTTEWDTNMREKVSKIFEQSGQ
jgi:hypothetical protein